MVETSLIRMLKVVFLSHQGILRYSMDFISYFIVVVSSLSVSDA